MTIGFAGSWSWVFSVALGGVLGCDSGGDVETAAVALVSPDGRIELAVSNDSEGRLSYTVRYQGSTVIEPSPLGLRTTTHDLTQAVTMFRGSERRVEESYEMLVGKRSEREVVGSENTVPLEDANGARAELVLRAHADGAAFRYRLLGKGTATVNEEVTGFSIPAGARGLVRPYDDGRDFAFIFTGGAYEQSPELAPVGEPTEATGFAFPVLFEIEEDSRYVMITEADLDQRYCATRLGEMPEGRLYRIRFPDEREGNGVGEVLPSSELPFETPWRVVMVGDLATVVESTLVDDLSRPSVAVDTSWVRPGRAAWSWFSQETGTPQLQSEYIDFAEEYGWDYVLIDANWDQWDNAEATVRALVAEGDAAGVRLFLWYNSGGEHAWNLSETPVDRMSDPSIRRAEMEKISGWGVAGIKVDFFSSDKQDRIAQYIGILEDASEYELLVNLHGATVPRGWQRTYRHLMAIEAVNGAEYYKDELNVLGDRAPSALTNLHHVLLRNVVGSMDYTPVTFEAALSVKELPYAHSLALAVLFESGIQHFADRADSDPSMGYRAVFGAYPYVGDFLSTVPVAWDDTQLIEGDLDDHVILARRRGTNWYVAGIHTAPAPVEYTFSLDFLATGTYELALIEQGGSADSFERTVQSVKAGDPVTITLSPNGGFVATLTAQ